MKLPRLLLAGVMAGLASCSTSARLSSDYYHGKPPLLVNGQAYAPKNAPASVHRAMAAANSIQQVPYKYGGGHGTKGGGLDCSGSVSYVLRQAGLLAGDMPSGSFRKYGKSGGGDWITVFAESGHVFMTICGLRLDTSSQGRGVGPRFSEKPRSTRRFKVRHPAGL